MYSKKQQAIRALLYSDCKSHNTTNNLYSQLLDLLPLSSTLLMVLAIYIGSSPAWLGLAVLVGVAGLIAGAFAVYLLDQVFLCPKCKTELFSKKTD